MHRCTGGRQRGQAACSPPRIGGLGPGWRTGFFDLGRRQVFGHASVIALQSIAQRIEALLHAPDALEQARVDQRSHRPAVVRDQNAVSSVSTTDSHDRYGLYGSA